MGFSRTDVPFHVAPRAGGTSKFPLLKLARMAMESIVSFSPLLMHGATAMGALFFLFSVGMAVHTLYLKIVGKAVEGFATVILIELMVGSAVLFALGIIGLYIARIHEELKGRPRYLAEESCEPSRQIRMHHIDSAA
jgi:dolichol-phosphate mannosyltransferase